MITQAFLIRMYVTSASVAAVMAIAGWFAWHETTLPAGVALGFLVGLAPFVSWHLILSMTDGFQKSRRGWIVLITLTKYAAVATLTYLSTTRGWVHPYALIAGILIPMVMLWILGAARMFVTPNQKVL